MIKRKRKHKQKYNNNNNSKKNNDGYAEGIWAGKVWCGGKAKANKQDMRFKETGSEDPEVGVKEIGLNIIILIIYSLFLSFFQISFRTTLAIVGGYLIGQAIIATRSLAGDIRKVTRGLLQLGIEQVVPIYSNQRVAYHNVCSIRPKISSISNRQETTYEARFGAVTIIGLADTGAMVNVVTSATLAKIPKG